MCKTYDCMGIALAVLVLHTTSSLILIIDSLIVAVWTVLLQLLLHILLVHGKQQITLALKRSALDYLGHNILYRLQHTMHTGCDCSLARGMG